ncbi:Globin-coupled histidine kinase [Marinomonas aquimarina]|uniref:histidine kinase n=1 Tax=Marinomonas aquimarina TaxID=295068 RepID=A0A1A8TIW7_9GAMM|nr:sensor histidine kinase [Marinomonas aquimarina]SBS33343.1 Globin-coupled histidine kinase [Marinomonas aquimarina]
MALSIAFELSIWVTSVCGVLVAVWLLWRARQQSDLRALAGFAVMMALWCFGHLALFHNQQVLGMVLLLANPLMPTFFLHFALLFVNQGAAKRPWLTAIAAHMPWVYATSFAIVIYSIWVGAGETVALIDGRPFFVFNTQGAVNLAYTVLLGILGHGVLILGWQQHAGNKKRSILAMFGVAAWGLLLATSFVFPSFGINVFPYPMLLLPSYLLLLVYGVVRYQMLEVNHFANRALLALAMMLVVLCVIAVLGAFSGPIGLQALATVPIWQLWLYSLIVLLIAAVVYPWVRRFSERLVFPGAVLNEQILENWNRELNQAESWQALETQGEQLLAQHLRQPVAIVLNQNETSEGLQVAVEKDANGWFAQPLHSKDISPGMRLTLDVFGSLFATKCAALERSLALAEAERKRLDEQHLVELGSLSAAMAHELRNPLNIISMASYNSPADTRRHIQEQLARADRLVSDMLVYSGKLTLHYQPVALKPLLGSVLSTLNTDNVLMTLQLEEGLELSADPHRLQQVLINLIDNALAFVRNQSDGSICVEAHYEDSELVCRIHNNGPALDPNVSQDELFRPFVSKRQGGSGLGLAIVRRIMDAHHGQIRHRDDLGWPVTFECRLPLDPQKTSNTQTVGETQDVG